MNRKWDKQIRRLEAILQSRAPSVVPFRYGHLRRLPHDSVGERHVAIVSRAATAVPHVERCEFEERLGLTGQPQESGFFVYLCAGDLNRNQS